MPLDLTTEQEGPACRGNTKRGVSDKLKDLTREVKYVAELVKEDGSGGDRMIVASSVVTDNSGPWLLMFVG